MQLIATTAVTENGEIVYNAAVQVLTIEDAQKFKELEETNLRVHQASKERIDLLEQYASSLASAVIALQKKIKILEKVIGL